MESIEESVAMLASVTLIIKFFHSNAELDCEVYSKSKGHLFEISVFIQERSSLFKF